jgi:hypothetical protein
MAAAITYATNLVPDSITNPDVDFSIARDNTTPFSFLEFITTTKVDYSPEEYNNFYINYLKDWSASKNTTRDSQSLSYVDHYVTFIKEIIVTFTTAKERKFLNSIDFSDPADLDVAIPFLVEKIRQVILFYKNKRDDAKYSIDRNKIKGTETSLEKGLYDNIYNYVFSAQDDPQYSSLGFTLSSISKYLKIDIEEYIDVYGSYFDLPLDKEESDFNAANGTLKEYYTSNYVPVDVKLFFTSSQYEEIFGSVAFLVEIPLIANVSLKFDPVCDPTNPLTLINNSKVTGLTNSDLLVLKKKLLEKYLGSDLYYIDTTGGGTSSGLLIKASNPSNNIHNLQVVSTPTVRSSEVKLLRNVGLFFTPDTQGIFQLKSNNFGYTIDESKLESNKIYVFPDPNRYGNVTINNLSASPLVFIHDYRPDVRNISSGFAAGVPKVQSSDQTFSPYYVTEQSTVNTFNNFEINLNFSDLYNKGYITKIQYDIYGNEYALFKDEFGQTFKTVETVSESISSDNALKYLQLDGYIFRDPNLGYNFNYEFTTRTVVLSTSPTFPLTIPYYTLSFRGLYPYDWFETQPEIVINTFNIIDSSFNSVSAQPEKITQQTKDGNSFTYDSGSPIADPIYAGYTNYPGNLTYYYEELMEGGVTSLTPPTIAREYSNNGALSAVFTLDTRLVLSSTLVVEYDGGNFTDVYDEFQDDTYTENIPRSNIVYDSGITAMSILTGDNTYRAQTYKEQLQGKIFSKTGGSATSRSISDSLSSIFSKYNNLVKYEIYNSPKDLEIFYNTICIETPSYLVFDKIVYEDSLYIEPSTSNTFFSIASSSPLNVFSHRFFNEKEKTVSFCKIIPAVVGLSGQLVTNITDTQLINSNNKMFIPYIYQHNITDNITTQLFPTNTEVSQLSSLFTLSSEFDTEFNFNAVRIKKPILTYNSLNDVYKLVYLLLDNNNHFHLIDYTFEITSDQLVSFLDCKWYKHANTTRTTDFLNTNFAIIGGSTNAGTITGTEVII